MSFKGLTDKRIRELMSEKTGIPRPTARDYFFDAMQVAPMFLGMPAAVGGKVIKFPGSKLPTKTGKPRIVGKMLREDRGKFLRDKGLLPKVANIHREPKRITALRADLQKSGLGETPIYSKAKIKPPIIRTNKGPLAELWDHLWGNVEIKKSDYLRLRNDLQKMDVNIEKEIEAWRKRYQR